MADFHEESYENEEDRSNSWQVALLLLLLTMICGVSTLFIRYLVSPAPLPELITGEGVDYEPHYLFSIYGLERPVGVATSPDGSRLYVTESSGDRLIKIYDQNGGQLGEFTAPSTNPGERSPVYLDIAPDGRVFVTDRTQHAVYVYDADGNYLDTILGPDLTLKEYVAKHTNLAIEDLQISYDIFDQEVIYSASGGAEESLPAPDRSDWSPLGVWFSEDGQLVLTDVTEAKNCIRIISPEWTLASDWSNYDPTEFLFGNTGQGDGEFLFPNAALVDSQGRIYVSDGNNGRISTWDAEGRFLYHFGLGSGDGSLSLPRGMAIDENDRLYVVDAVGQNVVVYDVSNEQPVFLYVFGDFGINDGLFNYPNDIAVGPGGRLYIVDRENNRIQVWLY